MTHRFNVSPKSLPTWGEYEMMKHPLLHICLKYNIMLFEHPWFQEYRHQSQVTEHLCCGKTGLSLFCGVFCLGLVCWFGFFSHVQAQIAKGGGNLLIDYLWLLNEGPFKEMSLSLSRQSHHLIACWFAVGNYLNRYYSWKSPVCRSAAAQMEQCALLHHRLHCVVFL